MISPVYIHESWPILKIGIITPLGILEKSTDSIVHIDSYGVGLGEEPLKMHYKYMEGGLRRIMGEAYFPDELVKDAIFYEKMHQAGRVAEKERNDVLEDLFSIVDSSFPSGLLKEDTGIISQ